MSGFVKGILTVIVPPTPICLGLSNSSERQRRIACRARCGARVRAAQRSRPAGGRYCTLLAAELSASTSEQFFAVLTGCEIAQKPEERIHFAALRTTQRAAT